MSMVQYQAPPQQWWPKIAQMTLEHFKQKWADPSVVQQVMNQPRPDMLNAVRQSMQRRRNLFGVGR